MLRKEISINTWYSRKKPIGETNNGELITVPNQTMSIRDILKKFTRIADVPGRKPEYPQEDFSELDKLDRFQKLDLARDLRQSIKDYQKGENPPKTTTTQTTQHEPSNAPASVVADGPKSEEKTT